MRFNVQRTSREELEEEIKELESRGFRQVSDIIEVKQEGKVWGNDGYRRKFEGWDFYHIYKVKMEGEKMNIVAEVSSLVEENERLQKQVQTLTLRLSKKHHNYETTKEKLISERNKRKKAKEEIVHLKTALAEAQKETNILRDNQRMVKVEKTNGKTKYKASIRFAGREMVIGYFNTAHEAREAELQAAANL